MTLEPDWDALNVNLERWSATLREARKKVDAWLPADQRNMADVDAYADARDELEEAIFNFLAAQCYLSEEIPQLYEDGVRRIRRLGFSTTPI